MISNSVQFSSVQSLSRVQLFTTLWTAACQASLSITNSWSLLKLMSIESVMLSNHLILCRPLILPLSIFPSIRVFSNESVLPMSSSNCYFLTCIQISQQAGKLVWYSHLFKNFSQFVVIHTVKGFDIISKAEVDVFLELSFFFNDPVDVGNLILVPLPFLNPAWVSGSSQFIYCWSLAWRILSITLLACEMNATVR